MALANVTVTAPVGPGRTVTSQVINGAREIRFLVEHETFEIVASDGRIHEFEYETIATVTYTISGETATVTITT